MRNNDEIITIIKSAMKEQDMSLSELARRVGVAKSAVSRYLNLTREFPLNRSEDFAKALVSVQNIYLVLIKVNNNMNNHNIVQLILRRIN